LTEGFGDMADDYNHHSYTRSKPILLADDDPGGVELVLAALAELDLASSIEVVEDGEAALDYIYQRNSFAGRGPGNPALILLDLKMPKVTGLDVLRTIKADHKTASIPVVVLTSSREESDLATCYRLGANAYVVKPVDYSEFHKAVTELGTFWARLNEPPPGTAA
jgi:CheY-like chemotaxis protein